MTNREILPELFGNLIPKTSLQERKRLERVWLCTFFQFLLQKLELLKHIPPPEEAK